MPSTNQQSTLSPLTPLPSQAYNLGHGDILNDWGDYEREGYGDGDEDRVTEGKGEGDEDDEVKEDDSDSEHVDTDGERDEDDDEDNRSLIVDTEERNLTKINMRFLLHSIRLNLIHSQELHQVR